MAEQTSCLHRGAPAPPDVVQCPYCNALLRTMACAICHATMLPGSKFCSSCGAAVLSISQSTTSELRCPRCENRLQTLRLRDESFEQCPKCAGLFIDNKALDRVLNSAESRSAAVGLSVDPAEPTGWPVVYLPCPRCAEPMGRLNYARRSGVILNVCRNDGIWLDRGQLPGLINFINSGGLDRARQVEKEQIEMERRRLELERNTSSGSGFALNDDLRGSLD